MAECCGVHDAQVVAECFGVAAVLLDRRMLSWRGGEVHGRPFGMDKPSGSLFVPPEYRSVNCFVCTASVESASVTLRDLR